MTNINICLPGQPRGKAKSFGQGRGFNNRKTEAYMKALRTEAALAMRGHELMQGSVAMQITAFYEIPKSWSQKKRREADEERILPTVKPDWDNIAKMMDALKGVVWRDDAQICDATFSKRYSLEPALYLEITGS